MGRAMATPSRRQPRDSGKPSPWPSVVEFRVLESSNPKQPGSCSRRTTGSSEQFQSKPEARHERACRAVSLRAAVSMHSAPRHRPRWQPSAAHLAASSHSSSDQTFGIELRSAPATANRRCRPNSASPGEKASRTCKAREHFSRITLRYASTCPSRRAGSAPAEPFGADPEESRRARVDLIDQRQVLVALGVCRGISFFLWPGAWSASRSIACCFGPNRSHADLLESGLGTGRRAAPDPGRGG